MLRFLEGRYCSRVWYLEIPAENCNVLGALFRDADHWTFTYRFRYFDEPNKSSWYETYFPLSESETQAVENIQQIMDTAAGNLECTSQVVVLGSADPKQIMEQLAVQPWISLRLPSFRTDATNQELN